MFWSFKYLEFFSDMHFMFQKEFGERLIAKNDNKNFGRIVDYFGVFDDAAKALQFDEQSIKQVITNLSVLREKLPKAIKETLQLI